MNMEEKMSLSALSDKVSEEATKDRDLKSSEIPNIDLYLDQILSLVSEKNEEAGDVYKDRNLTKTMVNNYAKAGLVSPPNGKKYSKKHIVEILMVNNLKNTLSLSEIKQISEGIDMKNLGVDEVVATYDKSVDDKEEVRAIAEGVISAMLSRDGERNETVARAVFSLSILSNYLKQAAELIVCEEYPVIEEKKPEKKEKTSEKKEKTAKKDE